MAPGGEWLVVRAARLIDGSGAPPIERPAVVIRGGRIHEIRSGAGPRAGSAARNHKTEAGGDAVPAGTPEINLPGHTLVPGLIDAHVHLVLPGDGTPFETSVREPDGVLLATAMHNAQTALRAGITTLRDCGSMRDTSLELRRAQQLGYAVIPRLHLCRCPMTITGGHCRYFGGEADGQDGVRQMVRRLVKAGVDFIKIMASGGGTVGTFSSRPSYTVEELRSAVDEAHRLNRRAGIHCTCAEATRNALAAGADHIEHALFLSDEQGRQRYESDVAEELGRRNVPVTSTLGVGHFLVDALAAKDGATPDERAAVDRWHRTNQGNMENARRMRETGVRYVAGTDAGWRFTPFDGLVREMELLHAAGLTTGEAIASATSWTAAAMGIGDQVGTLRAGLHADIIASAGDPLEDLGALRTPAMVMLGGVTVVEPR